jgi:hypothetical protein
MKRKLALIGLILIVAISSAAVGVYAATEYKLTVNGKVVKTDIREINGTLYAPIKMLTDSIGGLDYKFDKKTSAITVTPKAIPASIVGLSRTKPAPLGSTVNIAISDILDDYSISISVDQVIRGEEAWKLIQSANQFNAEPKADFEYVLVKISVKIIKSKKEDAQIDVSGYSFDLVSSAGKDYPKESIVEPDPSLNSKLYTGASHSGWAVFTVKQDDTSPLLTIGRKYDGTGGAWFKIKE